MNLITVRKFNGKDFIIFDDNAACGVIFHKDNAHWIATIPLPCKNLGKKTFPTFKLAKAWIGDCHAKTGSTFGSDVWDDSFLWGKVRFDLDASSAGRKFPALADSCWDWRNLRNFRKNDLLNVNLWFTTSAGVADKMRKFGVDPNNFGRVGVIWDNFVCAACKLAPDDFSDADFWDSGLIGNCNSWIWIALDIALWDWKC